MTSTIKRKSLRARAVQMLMNTINSFQSRYHLYQENTALRNELSYHRQQVVERPKVGEQQLTSSPKSHHKSGFPNSVSTNHPPSPKDINSHTVKPKIEEDIDDEEALRAEVEHYRERNAELLQRYAKLNEELKRKKIDSFESLAEYDKDTMKVLIELARLTEPIPLEGINIGLFGLTSTGKSTMLNALLGQKLAETGVGETTTEIKPYPGATFTLWDIPGRNDEVSYFSMEYISFFKGLTQRLILIQATVKENSSMMKLLDEIGLHYDIVFNKFDKVDEEERAEVQKQIRLEVEKIGLQGARKIYFVSAKNPKMFADWLMMTEDLVNP